MESLLTSSSVYLMVKLQAVQLKPPRRFELTRISSNPVSVAALVRSSLGPSHRKPPKNLRYPRRAKLPPDPKINIFLKKNSPSDTDSPQMHSDCYVRPESSDNDDSAATTDGLLWSPDEIEAISSLFQGRIPQKPGNLYRERPLPLPLPYKLRPLGLPSSKKHVRTVSPTSISSRFSLCKQVYKNPQFLISVAREIRSLPSEKDASDVLDKWARFLRKGSLSLTIRELGHFGLPERALQTFCWAQKQPHLFPDDRILASTVEILARTHNLKKPFDLEKFTTSATRSVIEAMARGFISSGSLNLARKLLLVARDNKRTLDASIHAKLILEIGKNPDKYKLVCALLDELGERDDLGLDQQDCTAVMKICIRLGRFDIVESLFNWFKDSGRELSVVMYTTLIYSRYSEKKYREALAVVWEMEESECVFDLPTYRVVIGLFVALNDISRAIRYFSKLKEAGFTPTYDIYRNMIKIYAACGRSARCKEVYKEAETAGYKFDKQIVSLLLQVEGAV